MQVAAGGDPPPGAAVGRPPASTRSENTGTKLSPATAESVSGKEGGSRAYSIAHSGTRCPRCGRADVFGPHSALPQRCASVPGMRASAPRRSSSMSPRPDLGPKPRLGYAASSIERAAERRADTAALAALDADPSARTYVVGGEWVALKRATQIHDPLFTPAEARGLGRTRRMRVSRPDGAGAEICRRTRPGGNRSAQDARRIRRHRLALDRDTRTGRCRPLAAARRGQGAAQLASAPSLLLELRRRHRARRRRLAARLPVLPRAALPAHRSGRDHAAGRRRALRARPLPSFPGRHVVVPRRLHRARRVDRGRRAAARPARRSASSADACPTSPPNPGRFRHR